MGMKERAIELLDKLEPLGFTDPAFDALHHRNQDSIAKFRGYLPRVGNDFVPNGTNCDVVHRLGLVYSMFIASGLTKGTEEIFVALAKVSVLMVPLQASYKREQ